MNRRLFLPLLCFTSALTVYAECRNDVGDTGRQAYNLNALVKKTLAHVQNSRQCNSLRLPHERTDEDFLFEASETLQNSSRCLKDLLYTIENLKNPTDQWALRLFDSYGKPDSGILRGSSKWIGDYDECVEISPSVRNGTVGNFRGQYCSLAWSLRLLNISLSVVSGICIPDSCSAFEIQEDILSLLKIADVLYPTNETIFTVTSLTCSPTERRLNPAAVAVIVLISVFCAFTVLGSSITIWKYIAETVEQFRGTGLPDARHGHPATGDKGSLKDDESLLLNDISRNKIGDYLEKCTELLSCFCIFKNGAKLLNTSGAEGELLCIHGIRFLSMSWVILGHAYIFCFQEIRNALDALTLVDNFAFQIVLQGFYSVDSFFVLSGFLLTYLSMQEFSKRKGSIFWPYFYFHRYLRLTPIYMIVLGFSATVYFYLGSGPFWPMTDVDPVCKKHWWWNLLYINNFNSQEGMCMGWSWYLANDMQFFVISPLFLISLWRWPKIGYSLLAIFLCATSLANFMITYHFELVTGIAGNIHDPIRMLGLPVKFPEYFDKIYIKPYTRIGPYLIGMFVGYLLFSRKVSKKPKHSWITLCVGWILATAITLTCVYGLYHSHATVLANSFYNALSRSCYAAGLAWVIYVCLSGQGGFVNSILSYKLFIPLSRLTYTAYLIHPLIMSGYYGSLKKLLEFSHPTMVVLFLGFMVVTYGLSLPVALIFESPIITLEKLVRKQFGQITRTEVTN